MANSHTTLTSLFDDIADAIRENTPVTEQIKADAFPAYIRMLGYDGTIPETPSILNSCSWDFIRWASDEGIADLIWSVGDRKLETITEFGHQENQYKISGGTFACYILGFNHNAEIEGKNMIHFEFGFTSISGGVHITFTGGSYALKWNNSPQYLYWPRMNPTETNAGGWGSSTMKTGTLNGSERSFKLSVTQDLRKVVKTVKKYTDNVGGGGSSLSSVTATDDEFFILNIMEMFGHVNNANPNEANYTKQYQYYKNGNPKLKYRSDELQTAAFTLLRSPRYGSTTNFNASSAKEGVTGYVSALTCYGISPAFCV